jgi:hypothetical protein
VDTFIGERIRPLDGRHTVGGSSANVQVWAGPGQMLIAYVPEQNNPTEHEAYMQAADLEGSINFYRSLFGVEPAKRRRATPTSRLPNRRSSSCSSKARPTSPL